MSSQPRLRPLAAPAILSDDRTNALVDRWVAEYQARTGRQLHEVAVDGFTYTYDIDSGRAVCVRGRSTHPLHARDQSRQAGSPSPRPGDDRGHLIAHSMGGGMDINLFSQNRHLNRGGNWRAIERFAAANPGTPIAVHLRYSDESDRPTSMEYAYEHTQRGLHITEFNNDGSRAVSERTVPPERDRGQRHTPSRECR